MPPDTKQSPGQLLDHYGVNLLLVGFPKCGTTSIANWLGQSDAIEVSNPKETFILTPEFGHEPYLPNGMPFQAVERTTTHRLEASTLSIYSDRVLSDIQNRESVRVIIAGRDSARAIEAWHSQMVNAGRAAMSDFDTNIARVSEQFDSADALACYRSVGAFGTITSRWIEALGNDRVFVLQQADLNHNSTASALLTRTLGIAPPGEVPSDNVRSGRRAPHLYNRLRSSSAIGRVKSAMSESEMGSRAVSTAKSMLFDKKAERASVPDEFAPWFAAEDETFTTLALANQRHWQEATHTWVD